MQLNKAHLQRCETLRAAGRKRCPSRPRLSLETLEERVCLSVYYDFNVLVTRANLGMSGLEGIPSTSLSLNDNGLVSFLANYADRTELVVVSDPISGTTSLSTILDIDGKVGRYASLNNQNQALIVTRDTASGIVKLVSHNALGVKSDATIAFAGPGQTYSGLAEFADLTDPFIFLTPTLSDNGQAAFTATKPSATPGAPDDTVLAIGTKGFFHGSRSRG